MYSVCQYVYIYVLGCFASCSLALSPQVPPIQGARTALGPHNSSGVRKSQDPPGAAGGTSKPGSGAGSLEPGGGGGGRSL